MISNIIPKQKFGTHTGATVVRVMNSRTQAIKLYSSAKTKLNDVNNWRNLCTSSNTEFKLTDEFGNVLESRHPQINNYIRIKIPYLNKSEEDYYWVRIEVFEHNKDILNDEESYGFLVRPADSPLTHKTETAHFYTAQASSTFLIVRKGRIIYAIEKGRNEIPNNNSISFIKKVKNLIVAVAAIMGFGRSQWHGLMQGIVKD